MKPKSEDRADVKVKKCCIVHGEDPRSYTALDVGAYNREICNFYNITDGAALGASAEQSSEQRGNLREKDCT